ARTRSVLPAPPDFLQAPPLFVTQPPRPDRLRHHASTPLDLSHDRVWKQSPPACQPTRRTFVASALASAGRPPPGGRARPERFLFRPRPVCMVEGGARGRDRN